MIHEVAKELKAALRERGCPLDVIDGPEPTKTTTFARERIVLEYGTGFQFSAPKSQSINPKNPWNLSIPAKITIYAQSGKAGALYFEHQRKALLIARMVAVALREVIVTRRNWPDPPVGDFVDPPDLEETERRGGAVFEMKFTFLTGVPELTWAGDIAPEGTLTGMTSTTRARFSNTDAGDGETACGG